MKENIQITFKAETVDFHLAAHEVSLWSWFLQPSEPGAMKRWIRRQRKQQIIVVTGIAVVFLFLFACVFLSANSSF